MDANPFTGRSPWMQTPRHKTEQRLFRGLGSISNVRNILLLEFKVRVRVCEQLYSKIVTSSRARPDARDDYWFRSQMPNQLS